MKRRTISKIVTKKVDDWLDSITDEVVKKACESDLIVTGGSIASMLLNQDVNDFDIYFKTKRTVQLVSEYYVSKINKVYTNRISDTKITVVDSDNIPTMEYEDLVEQSKWSQFKEGLQRDDEKRIKIYIPHIGYWRRSDKTESSDTEEPEKNSFEPIYLTENAITLSDDIQLVIRFFGDVEEIHKNYDFAHATNYFHNENGKYKLVLRAEAMEALLTKELIYIGSKYPLTSVIRTKKFLLRGYTVSAGTYLKILWQVAELNLKDPIVLQEQLIGVDIAYFSQLIEILSKVDPEKLSYNYISTIIDKVFSDQDED